MLQNGQMTYFWEKLDQTLGQIIFGTKCDRDKCFILQKEEVNKTKLAIKKGTQCDVKM